MGLNREVEGSIPSTDILLFDYLMLHLEYILYTGSLYGEDYLPLSSVYFIFPRNIKVKVKIFRRSDSDRGRPAQMWPIASNSRN